jgi:NAD-dependent deacetylase
LRSANRAVVLTGAGISAESGVPTFRDAQTGLWARYAPEDLATPQAFAQDPRLVWEWYAWRRELVAQAAPNPGHQALVILEEKLPSFTLITQNVDGLHVQAGSRNVIELHGNIQRTKCFREETLVESWEDTGSIPPLCPRCGAFLRPDVVWFGEMLPPEALNASLEAAENCDIFFSIGTSGLVQPAASLPYLALRKDIPVVEINPAATPLSSSAAYLLPGPAGVILPQLVKAAWPEV